MAFITSLRIKNFFSIKDEVSIDFKASQYNIENNPKRLFEFNGEYYNKVISFYGANASGKTTILKSLVFISSIVNNERTDDFPMSFKNSFAHLNSKSEVNIGFVLEVNNEYKEFFYTLKLKSEKHKNIGIDNEELFFVLNGKKETIFNRKNRKIKNVDENIIISVFDNLHEKKSLFQEFEKFEKTEILKDIKFFFRTLLSSSNINVYNTKLGTDSKDEFRLGMILDNHDDKDKTLNNFFISFFKSINIDIEKIQVNFNEDTEKDKELKSIEIFHKVNLDEPLDFKLESDGTQMLMKVLLDIYMIHLVDGVLVIDEFDSIIHPMLTPIIINLLIENNIQIIYSTHNIYNMQFLQNDEVFLIEKNEKHKTTIKPVKDNPDIKGYKNLLTLYENGYLGGVPNVKELITKII